MTTPKKCPACGKKTKTKTELKKCLTEHYIHVIQEEAFLETMADKCNIKLEI